MIRSTSYLASGVGDAEVEARDDDEAQDDGGGLTDLTAVRPLHALKLGPGGAQEGDEAEAALLGRARRVTGLARLCAAGDDVPRRRRPRRSRSSSWSPDSIASSTSSTSSSSSANSASLRPSGSASPSTRRSDAVGRRSRLRPRRRCWPRRCRCSAEPCSNPSGTFSRSMRIGRGQASAASHGGHGAASLAVDRGPRRTIPASGFPCGTGGSGTTCSTCAA